MFVSGEETSSCTTWRRGCPQIAIVLGMLCLVTGCKDFDGVYSGSANETLTVLGSDLSNAASTNSRALVVTVEQKDDGKLVRFDGCCLLAAPAKAGYTIIGAAEDAGGCSLPGPGGVPLRAALGGDLYKTDQGISLSLSGSVTSADRAVSGTYFLTFASSKR